MAAITGSSSLEPVLLQVGVGDAVLVEPHEGGWWVGQVIHCEGGARCSANSFFQITDVDSGAVRTVNPNLVTGIVRKGHGEQPSGPFLDHRNRCPMEQRNMDNPKPRALTYSEMMNGGKQQLDSEAYLRELDLARRTEALEEAVAHLEQSHHQ